MTIAICDPWIERLISSGQLAPGARGLSREQAAEQYNQVNGLDPSDHDFLYTPGQAAAAARDALAIIGIDVPADARILLTDGASGPRCWSYLVEPSQLEYACEQHRLTTGETINPTPILEALPWF